MCLIRPCLPPVTPANSARERLASLCRWLLTIVVILIPASDVTASPKGWKWYNEPTSPPVTPAPVPTPPNTTTTVMSATEQMAWFHQTYEEVKADATLNPDDEQKYLTLMKLHHFIGQQTARTGMTFKKLLLKYPEYSYVKDRPVEQAARSTYHRLERQKKIDTVIKMRDDGWGVFFVYQGNDPLSQELAPSIQHFADTYDIELLGVSEDGLFTPHIRQNRVNNNKVVVPFTPALLLINPTTSEFQPLAYGFISQEDLLGRFYNVATRYQSADF